MSKSKPKSKQKVVKDDRKKKGARLALGISIGLLFGVAMGGATDSYGLWIPIGVMYGLMWVGAF